MQQNSFSVFEYRPNLLEAVRLNVYLSRSANANSMLHCYAVFAGIYITRPRSPPSVSMSYTNGRPCSELYYAAREIKVTDMGC